MYFFAACLVGLRPLFSRLPRWISKHLTSKDKPQRPYGVSVFGSHSKGMPLNFVRPGPSTRLGSNDTNSLSHMVPVDRDAELGCTKDYLESNDYILRTPPQTRQIRVDTQIEVESGWENAMHDRQGIFGRKL